MPDRFKNAPGVKWASDYYYTTRKKHKNRREARLRMKRATRREALDWSNDND